MDEFFDNPLRKYSQSVADVFLEALSMIYKVNIIVFQSNESICDIINNINQDNNFPHTLYFVRAGSLHFDPVVPFIRKKSNTCILDSETLVEGNNPEYHSDSSDSPLIVSPVKISQISVDNQPLSKKVLKSEDFRVSSVKGCDSDDSVTIISDDDPLEVDSDVLAGKDVKVHSKRSMLDDFVYVNPEAKQIFHMILVEPEKYEVPSPLKRVRENRVFLVKDCILGDITSDDNHAYHKTNSNEKEYYVKLHENGCDVHILHKDERGFYYKKRPGKGEVSKKYQDVYVNEEDIYLLNRYYRFSKVVPGLKQMVMHVKSYSTKEQYPHWCVVYSIDETKVDVKPEPACHGNSKQPLITSKSYLRTNPSVLSRIDNVLQTTQSPTDVFHQVLDDYGGPMHSLSPSSEPRSTVQVQNRKSLLKRKLQPSPSLHPLTDLDRLIMEQRNPESPVQTVLVSDDHYIAFIYTPKQLKDIELFCCNLNDNDACVLGVDTTFNLCDLWVTDTSYRNKRLISTKSRANPVYLGPVMLHFTKDEEAFRRFCLEMISVNPAISNLRKIGVDMEAAIFNGFKSVLTGLFQLYCVRHLQQRDEKAVDKCHEKVKSIGKNASSYKQQIMWDIYGKRFDQTFQEGLADAEDSDDFNTKLLSLKPRWDKLCPGFYNWFLVHRKKEFIESVIKSAREGTNVSGLYYQNDVESKHAQQKRLQCYQKKSVIDAVNTIKTLINRESNQEMLSIYGGDKYVLSQSYRNWFTERWHSWDDGKKQHHLQKFRSAKPSIEETFHKPANAGRKPGHKDRIRITSPPSIIVDRHTPTTMPSLVSSSAPPMLASASAQPQPVLSTPSVTSTRSHSSSTVTTSCSTAPSDTSTTSSAPIISFPDPRQQSGKVFELYLRADLPSTVVKCRGNCGDAITRDEVLLVKSVGHSPYRDPVTRENKIRFGNLYIHFKENCLKTYDSDEYYAPNEPFNYSKIKLNKDAKAKLSDADIAHLHSLGIK